MNTSLIMRLIITLIVFQCMAASEVVAHSLAWEEAHPRSPAISPRGVGTFLKPPSKPPASTREAISNAHAECDRDCRRLQRTRLLTQSQRPQSASADQRRQHARDSRRPVTQPETKTCTRQVLTPDLSDITYGPWGATCLDHSVGELRRGVVADGARIGANNGGGDGSEVVGGGRRKDLWARRG